MENELTIDSIVNYIVEETKDKFGLEGMMLTEKTSATKKIKLKFERGKFKLNTEFAPEDMAEVIYDNFIDDLDKEKVFLSDFKDRFIEAISTIS